MQERLPLTILTGFLGSGKTTLLNALLRDPAWAESAVVVNELGEIGLDHLLVAEAKENIVLLEAGCLCCAALDSLPETLADLYARRAKGDVPKFRRVLVETTGLADPAPIIRTLMRDPMVSHFYQLQGVVCAVDAVFGEGELKDHHEAQSQVALADRLVITKTDLAGGAVPFSLAACLRAVNAAPIVDARTDAIAALFESAAGAAPWLTPLPSDAKSHLHDSGIGAESFWIERETTWAGVANWINYTRDRYGGDLLRVKGLLALAGAGAPLLLHGVQMAFDTKMLRDWPDSDHRSRLILIGRKLDRRDIENSLTLLHDGSA